MEKTLIESRLFPVKRTDDVLYMRGTGTRHHIHETRKASEARFVGAVLEVSSRDDLDELAGLPGSSEVEQCSDPGGGWQVRMTMPDGFQIDAI